MGVEGQVVQPAIGEAVSIVCKLAEREGVFLSFGETRQKGRSRRGCVKKVGKGNGHTFDVFHSSNQVGFGERGDTFMRSTATAQV